MAQKRTQYYRHCYTVNTVGIALRFAIKERVTNRAGIVYTFFVVDPRFARPSLLSRHRGHLWGTVESPENHGAGDPPGAGHGQEPAGREDPDGSRGVREGDPRQELPALRPYPSDPDQRLQQHLLHRLWQTFQVR